MKTIFDPAKRIRLGIWGLGRGASFIHAAKSLNIDVVAGCDLNPAMRRSFAELCPEARLTNDDTEFLSYDFDAVLIATFFPAHADHAIRALAAGKHVLSEVTAFFTPAQGVRLVEAVEKSGKIYNLLENYPFTKENLYLAKLWREGFFGEFQYGEFDYLHECRRLSYAYNTPGHPGVEPGWTAHNWRSWLDFHYYNTHSLGPAMLICGIRPESVTAFPGEVPLAGYLTGSRMGNAAPSLIRMSNGGIVRNLMGSTTDDRHHGKRIFGTRAAARSTGQGLTIRVGAGGSGPELAIAPEWPELGHFAEAAGHDGGDFWELYYFAREFFTGEKAPWDIYAACDVTLAGIMAVRSTEADGCPMRVPDFRDRSAREIFREDERAQAHFDPQLLFPPGHDRNITGNFSSVMSELCDRIPEVRAACDGLKLYDRLADDTSRGAVIRSIVKLLAHLPQLAKRVGEATEICNAYPDSAPAQALREMLELGKPFPLADSEVASAMLLQQLRALR